MDFVLSDILRVFDDSMGAKYGKLWWPNNARGGGEGIINVFNLSPKVNG
jgi:hypothetical protein